MRASRLQRCWKAYEETTQLRLSPAEFGQRPARQLNRLEDWKPIKPRHSCLRESSCHLQRSPAQAGTAEDITAFHSKMRISHPHYCHQCRKGSSELEVLGSSSCTLPVFRAGVVSRRVGAPKFPRHHKLPNAMQQGPCIALS